MVTNARFVVGTKTFAMRGITSVEVVELDEVVERNAKHTWPTSILNVLPQAISGVIGAVSIIAGVFCWLSGSSLRLAAGIVGGGIFVSMLVILIAALLSTKWKRAFKIVLKTAGGDVTAYQSFDQGHISQISRALNDSIIAHG